MHDIVVSFKQEMMRANNAINSFLNTFEVFSRWLICRPLQHDNEVYHSPSTMPVFVISSKGEISLKAPTIPTTGIVDFYLPI